MSKLYPMTENKFLSLTLSDDMSSLRVSNWVSDYFSNKCDIAKFI